MRDLTRYTGTYHPDGTNDCSVDLSACQYEYDDDCYHCGQSVREHVNEDGSYILVEPLLTRVQG